MIRIAAFLVIIVAGQLASRCLAADTPILAVEKSISVDGSARRFLLFVPSKAAGPLPVLVVLHGGGSNTRQMERYTQFNELAQRDGFIVIYPEAVGGNWNDGRRSEFIRAQRENIDDVRFIRAVIDAVAKQYAIDRSRVFVTGISNGAMMAHRLAAEASDLIAGAATVAGEMAPPIAESFRPTFPVSILIIHGDADPAVPINGGDVRLGRGRARGQVVSAKETLAKYLDRNGSAGEPTVSVLDSDLKDGTNVEITKYPDGPGGVKTWYYLVKNGGHTWPGRPLYLPENTIGKASQDFSASEAIWQFFKSCPSRSPAM